MSSSSSSSSWRKGHGTATWQQLVRVLECNVCCLLAAGACFFNLQAALSHPHKQQQQRWDYSVGCMPHANATLRPISCYTSPIAHPASYKTS
jgi:hypothetical protein